MGTPSPQPTGAAPTCGTSPRLIPRIGCRQGLAGAVLNPAHFTIMALLDILGARPEDLATYADQAAAADQRLRYVVSLDRRARARGTVRGTRGPHNQGI